MSESHDLGQQGEELAVEYLKNAGYRILFRNWKWGKHEIDIIAENQDFIVFAEVKTRSNDFQMDPVTAVTREKQKSIIWAANGYLQKFGIDKEARFDIVTVIKSGDSFKMEHLEGAFYATLR